MTTRAMLAAPAAITARAIVAACDALPGPLGVRVETHRSATRLLRWFFLHGCGERGVEATLVQLVRALGELVVVITEDAAGFASIRRLAWRGRKVALTRETADEGDDAVIAELFSPADRRAYVTGVDHAYGEARAGWASYGRIDGPLTRDARIADEVDVSESALDWCALDDWAPGAAPRTPPSRKPPARERAPSAPEARPKREKAPDAHKSWLPALLRHTRDAQGERWATGARISWSHADAHGLIGSMSLGANPDDDLWVIWCSDGERGRAFARHSVRGHHTLLVDATHVYCCAATSLQRFARDGSGATKTVARAPWMRGVHDVTQDADHVYFTTSAGVRRVDKASGEITSLTPDTSLQSGMGALVDAGAALVVPGWPLGPPDPMRIEQPSGIALVSKRDGSARLLTPLASATWVAASEGCVFWRDEADPQLVHVDQDGARSTLSFPRRRIFLLQIGQEAYALDRQDRGTTVVRLTRGVASHVGVAPDASSALITVEQGHLVLAPAVGAVLSQALG